MKHPFRNDLPPGGGRAIHTDAPDVSASRGAKENREEMCPCVAPSVDVRIGAPSL
jgi:hypothetical protein